MNPRKRTRRAAYQVCSVLLSAALPTFAADKDWLVQHGTWGTATNWSPLGVPGAADNAFVGNVAGAHNAYVELAANASVANLTVNDGMMIRTEGFRFDVSGNASFSGKNEPPGPVVYYSGLRLGNGANAYDFRANNVTFSNQARLDSELGTLRVDNLLDFQDGTFYQGDGTFNLYGNAATALRMNGRMSVELNGLVINQFGDGRVDLDGTIADNNLINVTGYNAAGTQFAFFEINGTSLTDAYNERFWLADGNQLNMNLSDGWTLGNGGRIDFLPGLAGDARSEVNGGTFTVNGLLDVSGNAYAAVHAPTILSTGSDITIGEDGRIDFEGATTINGVTVTMQEGGDLDFDGPTTVISGTFSSFSDDWFDGETSFDGPTNWRGNVTLNGVARVNGNSTVSLATIINGQSFDMDGLTPFSTWTINAPLQINTEHIDLGANTFYGDMIVNANNPLVPAYVEINLPAGDHWHLMGSMTLNGAGNGMLAQSVRGSELIVGGTLTVNGNNSIQPRLEVLEGGLSDGYVNITANSSLRLDGGSIANPNIMSGGRIAGAGTLRASGDHALVGHGAISSAIEFATTAELRALDGVLQINGAINDVGVIGTAGPSGILNVGNAWETSVANRVELLGGDVRGATILNDGTITGHGTVFPFSLANIGTISAVGGDLLLNTVSNNLHLSGFGNGHLRAVDGNIIVAEMPTLHFFGNAQVGAGRSITLAEGWTVGSIGTVQLNGTPASPATIAGTTQLMDGATVVNGTGRFEIATTFDDVARVFTTAAADSLQLVGATTVNPGATFSGPGEVRNMTAGSLTLRNASTVGIKLVNAGPMTIESDSATGIGNVQRFEQSSQGTLRMQIGGTIPGTQFDRLSVAIDAQLNGALDLDELGVYNPPYLQSHEIIRADSVLGFFATVPANKIAANKYWAVTYADDGVFATAALPGDANLDGSVNITDFAILASQFNTAGPWVEGNFNGDAMADINDFAMLAANFNTAVLGDLPRGAAVPESTWLTYSLLPVAMVVRRKRRRG